MSTLSFKCPSCGAPLTYDGKEQQMTCGSCGNSFDPKTIQAIQDIKKEDAGFEEMRWQQQDDSFTQQELEQTRSYSCSSCGAQLYTDETTVATECAFCGSPSVIPAQFTPGTRPSFVLPFLVDKETAEKSFRNYFKTKKLIPNLFLQGPLQIKEIRKLYAPYWVFDCVADARMTYRTTTVSSHRSGNYNVRTTRHFLVRRAGTLDFHALPVDASSKLSNQISESIEPFQRDKNIPFSPEVLSGAQANRADVSVEESQQRANQRIHTTTDQVFRNTVSGYATVMTESSSIRINNGTSDAALYPIWLITTEKGGTTYTFAINGQTGELTCDIPWSKGKFFGRMLSMALGVTFIAAAAAFVLFSMGVIK